MPKVTLPNLAAPKLNGRAKARLALMAKPMSAAELAASLSPAEKKILEKAKDSTPEMLRRVAINETPINPLPEQPERRIPSKEMLEREIGAMEKRLQLLRRRNELAHELDLLESTKGLGDGTGVYGQMQIFLSRNPELARVPLSLLRSPDRSAAVCKFRFLAYRVLHNHGFSYSCIGRFLCRDHGAVAHGIRQLDQQGARS